MASERYRDVHFSCWHCETPSVFTAEQQEQAFAVRQAYIWQRRMLCEICWRIRRDLETRARAYAAKWRVEKSRLMHDKHYLKAWLAALEELPGYAARRNAANIAMLRNLLENGA